MRILSIVCLIPQRIILGFSQNLQPKPSSTSMSTLNNEELLASFLAYIPNEWCLHAGSSQNDKETNRLFDLVRQMHTSLRQ